MMALKGGKDVSRKIYREDVVLLDELETALLRRGIKTSQKELIDKSIKFVAGEKERFLEFINRKEKDNTKELVERFLSHPKKDFGKNFLQEIDTTL